MQERRRARAQGGPAAQPRPAQPRPAQARPARVGRRWIEALLAAALRCPEVAPWSRRRLGGDVGGGGGGGGGAPRG